MSNRVEEFNKFIACDLMKFYITLSPGLNKPTLKELSPHCTNRQIIEALIKSNNYSNKAELVRASGLSRSTVEKIVKDTPVRNTHV